VDTLGHLLALRVSAASSEQEREYGGELAQAVQEATGESVELAYVDQGYTAERAAEEAEAHGLRLEVVGGRKARRGQAGLCAPAAPVGGGAGFGVGIALSAVGEGLREAARHFGRAAFRRLRLSLPPAGSRHSQHGFITRSRETHLAALSLSLEGPSLLAGGPLTLSDG